MYRNRIIVSYFEDYRKLNKIMISLIFFKTQTCTPKGSGLIDLGWFVGVSCFQSCPGESAVSAVLGSQLLSFLGRRNMPLLSLL